MTDKPDALDRAGGCIERLGNFALLMFLNLVWVGLFFWGNYYFQNSRNLTQNGVEVQGNVSENRLHTTEDGDSYTPVFQYVYEGQTYTVESSNSSYPAKYRVGEAVTLLVDPANPSQAGANSWGELWGATVGLWCGAALGGLISNGAAVGALLRGRKR